MSDFSRFFDSIPESDFFSPRPAYHAPPPAHHAPRITPRASRLPGFLPDMMGNGSRTVLAGKFSAICFP